jgi:phosphinothricin acetyltransferase
MSSGRQLTRAAPIVRDAADEDLPAITAIYASFVRTSYATCELEAPSLGEMATRRNALLQADLPYLVAELEGAVVGYAYAGPYRSRPAYRDTIEDSIYVAEAAQGRGVGRILLETLIARCEAGPWRQMIAVIGDSANAGSIALHARMGFRHVGTLEAVGFKLGRWLDTVLMQRPLGRAQDAPPDARP